MSKLSRGEVKSATAFYGERIVVQFAMYPLILTVFATDTVNVGMLKEITPAVEAALQPVCEKAELVLP